MEEPMAENGGSQVPPPLPPPPNANNVGGGDWMDLGGFSALICELQATVTLAEKWIIIQHARFDFSVESEPYHASQVLVNQETKEFIVRVWGKTFRKGNVASIADLQDICRSALGANAASCPGHYSDNLSHLFEHMPSFTQLTHPFKRWVSRGCQVLYEKQDASGDSCRVKICSSCSSIKEEPTEGGFPSNHLSKPNKVESLNQLDFRKLQPPLKNEDYDYDHDQMNPEDYLEVGYHDDPEKLIRLSENPSVKRKIRKQAKKVAKAGKQACEMCGKEFALSQHLRSHIIQDHQWGIFTCHICLYVLFHPDELTVHMQEIHKDEEGGGIAKCPHCKEDITLVEDNISVLLDHYKKCVLTERPKPGEKVKEKIVCETCGKEVTCKSQLKIHMMKHTGETPFKCQVPGCGKGFPTKNNLKKHEEMHERHKMGLPMPKNFICDLCGNTFLCRANLREHIALKHEKKSMNIKCTECHLVFVHRREMYRHKYSVHFTDKYKCHICGKHFGISTQLKKHMAVHEPEGRFECELCGARLKGKSSYTEHMRVHRGEKPFKCPYCDYRGTSSSLLIHHKRGRHKAELEMEMLEKERQSIKVPIEVQQQAAEAAGIPIGIDEMMQHSVGSEHDPHAHAAHAAMPLDIKPFPPHPGMPMP